MPLPSFAYSFLESFHHFARRHITTMSRQCWPTEPGLRVAIPHGHKRRVPQLWFTTAF